jgi:N-methylhydantoinase B/oxoprolinase/acetone carboxylase alpha subunit
VPVHQATKLKSQTGFGGGWGPPKERDRALLVEDVREGRVPIEQARESTAIPNQSEAILVDQ